MTMPVALLSVASALSMLLLLLVTALVSSVRATLKMLAAWVKLLCHCCCHRMHWC